MQKDYFSPIGERIKLARESRGLKTCELADLVGKNSDNTISQWETGKQPIKKISDLILVADALNVTTDYLLLRSDSMSMEEDLHNAAVVTGLTDAAIESIQALTRVPEEFKSKYPDLVEIAEMNKLFLNEILEPVEKLGELLQAMKKYSVLAIPDNDSPIDKERAEYSKYRLSRIVDNYISEVVDTFVKKYLRSRE